VYLSDEECATLIFPLECPACKKVSGAPYRASTMLNGGVRVEVRCRDCGHDWCCTIPSQLDPEMRIKPDRRRQAP